MEDQTEIIRKPTDELKPRRRVDGSHLVGMSVRAWIALIVVGTVCYMSIMELSVKEPLYTLAGLIVGFFFGQSPKPQSVPQTK